MRFMFSSETLLGMEWSEEKMKPPFYFNTGTFSQISATTASVSCH